MTKNILLLSALLSPLVAFATIEQKVEKTFQVQPAGKLQLKACKGKIDVSTSKDPVVKLELREKIKVGSQEEADTLLANYEFTFEQSGADVQLIAKRKDGSRFWANNKDNKVQFEWFLTVPENYNLNLDTSGGSIRVASLTGDVKADTSGGSIDIGAITGNVNADTSGGSIKLASATGTARLDTSGGSIHAGVLKGESNLDTSGGSISVDQAFAKLRADTSGGSIDVFMPSPIQDECSLDTSGGSITFRTDVNAAFYLQADTSGGRVTCDLPILIKGKAKSNHMEGAVNGGGPKVRLDTSGGSIHVVKKG